MRPLDPDLLGGPSDEVAPRLLGVRWRFGGHLARITEVEAYSQDDPASHSFRGPTARTEVMFGPPGVLYVYLIYGMWHCANIVTGPVGYGAGVLIRSVEVAGIPTSATTGPGRVCRALGIDRRNNGDPVELYPGDVPPSHVEVTTRIGVTKAVERPWRWVIATTPEGETT